MPSDGVPENAGVKIVDEVTVDVTSLTNTGAEPYSTWTDESGVDVLDSIVVIGQEEDDQILIPDHQNDQFHVVAVSDGTDVTSGADIGEVRVRLEGRR